LRKLSRKRNFSTFIFSLRDDDSYWALFFDELPNVEASGLELDGTPFCGLNVEVSFVFSWTELISLE